MNDSSDTKRGGGLWRILLAVGVVVSLLVIIAGGAIYWYSTRIITDWESRGFVAVSPGEYIDLNAVHTEKKWYWADSVTISGHVQNDVALFVNKAEVFGKVDGDLEFFGRALIVHPEAEVGGKIIIQSASEVVVPEALRAKTRGTAANFQTTPDVTPEPAPK
ncbi:MAG: hypothetical protein AAF581_14230 [Planctomycetota bacterium]